MFQKVLEATHHHRDAWIQKTYKCNNAEYGLGGEQGPASKAIHRCGDLHNQSTICVSEKYIIILKEQYTYNWFLLSLCTYKLNIE